MPSGLQVFNESGVELFDSNLVQYGLLKAGYLTFTTWWPWYYLRSAQLDPNDQDNYAPEDPPKSPIWTISVTGAINPVAFCAGQAILTGQSGVSGGTYTFYFQSVVGNPKIYIFDLMRDMGTGVGMQVFNESGVLTFTSEMPALNIVGTAMPEPPAAGFQWGNEMRWGQPYGPLTSGAYMNDRSYYYDPNRERPVGWDEAFSQPYNPTGAAEIAVRLTFSRACGVIGRAGATSGVEGCVGGSVARFAFMQSAFSTWNFLNSSGSGGDVYVGIPTDRYPTMQIIDTSHYPFPFN